MKKEQTIVNVNHNEMVNVLSNVKSNQMINLVMLTEPQMNKTDNPFYNKETKSFTVKKLTSKNFRLSNYNLRVFSNMVKNGMNPESFVPEKPYGKTKVEGTDFVYRSDKDPNTLYFMVEHFDGLKPQFVTYLNNGQPMDEIGVKILKDYLRTPTESQKQEQTPKVKVITPKVENIVSITYNRTKFILV